LGRGESWKCSANSDGEHQETSSYVQHLLLLEEDTLRKARRGVVRSDRITSAAPAGFRKCWSSWIRKGYRKAGR
jgi:hypothetical protein